MGNDKATDKSADAPRETESVQASEKLAADSRSEIKISSADAAKYNVDRQKVGSSDDYTLYTQYPNGVKMDRSEAAGVLKKGGSYTLEPPPGGSKVEVMNGRLVAYNAKGEEVDRGAAPKGIPEGTEIVKDASGKEVARLDPDKTLHVHTKRGEYTETADGKLSFKPSGATSDLQSLHKDGAVAKGSYEDYGLSGNGSVTRFPNGLEWDRSSNKILIPNESQNFRSDKETDGDGHLTKVTVRDADGKVLYIQDGKGFHVPTADGVLTQTSDGKVSFKSNKPVAQQTALHSVEITGR